MLIGRICKRTIDLILSVVLLLIFTPLFLIISFAVAMDGGPLMFAHERVGRNGKLFGCLKFRTMIVGAVECFDEYLALHPIAAQEWRSNQKLEFDPRITGIGKLLRKTSLDELPQLINVLLGDMSLVGPRPITQEELRRYGDSACYYLSVRPGITGLWQVSGRNGLSYNERVSIDTFYVRTQSIWRDFSILYKTFGVVVTGNGK